MKKKMLSLLLALVMVFALAACGAPSAEAPAADRVTYTDGVGREVELPADITRIVPSAPLAQIVLMAIAPDLMVGLADELPETARGFVPEGLFDLPYFGNLTSGRGVNVEELALTAPDVILDIGEPKASAAEDLDVIADQTHIPVYHVSVTLETMPETYRALGELLGREARGEELAQFCERVYARTLSIVEQVGENKVNCLYVLGEEGLNVIAANSYHSELVDLLTNNLAVVENPSAKGLGNEVTMEQISLWDPEFVIFAPGSIYSTVEARDTWGQMAAIEAGNFVEVPHTPHNWMGMPPSVQRYLGLIWLPAVLYPEYCDYDVKAEIVEYYRLFCGCELTDEQYGELTAHAFLR